MTLLRRETSSYPALASDASAPSFLEAARHAILRPETTAVSFDIFDTLLKRRSPTPIAFFDHIGSRLAAGGWLLPHISPAQFRAQRVAAEKRARQRMQALERHSEVRLADIWAALTGVLAPGMAPEEAAEAEFAIERDHVFGNAPVLDLLALAQRRGRRIVLVSDTYFSAAQVAAMLRRAAQGRDDLDLGALRIFASSEHRTGKGGGLFDIVLRELGADPAGLVHLGDNYHADVEAAARRGIQALLLPNGTSEGWEILAVEDRYRPFGERALPAPGGAAALAEGEIVSLRNTALLHSAASGGFDHFAFGCFVIGPVLHQYLRWVERVMDWMGRDAIACGLLREGGFLAELLAERLPGRKVVALGISRVAMARAALTEVTAETLTAALPTRHAIPFAAYAARLGLSLADFPRCYWTRSLSSRDQTLVEEIVGHVLAEPALRERVAAEAEAFRARMQRHLAAVLGGEVAAGRSCLLLDVGWAGTIQDHLIRNFGLPRDRLIGLYLALNDRGLARCVEGLRAAGFLFDGSEANRLAGPGMRFVEIVEQATTLPSGSVVDYDEAGAPVFGADSVPAAQRAARAEVQRGIRVYLQHAARHEGAGPPPDPEAGRAAAQAIFLRACLAPSDAERRLFTGWVHDDSFADGALDALVPEPHRRIAPYMTPAQLVGAAFLHTYWPYGTLDPDSRLLAEQAAVAQLHGDRFDLFARRIPLQLEVALDGGPGWTLGAFRDIAVNAFNRFAVDLEVGTFATDRLLLRLRPGGFGTPPRLALEAACFAQAGGAEHERQVVALDATGIGALLQTEGGDVLPPDGAVALERETALRFRLPEQVMRWRGRVRLVLGFHLQDRPRPSGLPVAAGGGEPLLLKGWFDSLLGVKTPIAEGEIPLDPAATMLSTHGWVVDTAEWRGPDSVQLAFEGAAGALLRFDAELYPRPDIPRGFRRAVRGLTGCRCHVPLSGLPLGRWEVAWEARFGGQAARLRAPYAVTLEVDDRQRPRLSVEVIGNIHYA